MGTTARKTGQGPRLLGGWGQEGACPQCGHVGPREGAADWGHYGGLPARVGPALPSAALAMARARLSKREMSPADMAPVLPDAGAAQRGPAPAAGARQGAADGGDGRHAELVGTLARFIAYLKANGILADVEAPRGHHVLHMHACIARGLGMRIGYGFDFLEFGAFSVGLEVDLFRMGIARGGSEPFGGNPRASAAFLNLVRGRDEKWLEAATFAMRERGREGALEDFVAAPQGIIQHDAETARSAFGEVERAMRALAGAEPRAAAADPGSLAWSRDFWPGRGGRRPALAP